MVKFGEVASLSDKLQITLPHDEMDRIEFELWNQLFISTNQLHKRLLKKRISRRRNMKKRKIFKTITLFLIYKGVRK